MFKGSLDDNKFQADAYKRFNTAFGLMTIIPLLICIYLVTVKFLSINILVGPNGAYFLMVIVIALLGLLYGRTVMETVFKKLAETTAQLKRLVGEEITLNEQLLAEIEKRERMQESLKLAQEQLIQAAKMESIGELAAGAAHEVKNPLAILMMGVDYLKKGANDPEKTQFMLSKMDNAVRRADAVIRGLLDFASPTEMEPENVDLNGLIEQTLTLVKHELDKSRVQVAKDFDPHLDPIPLDKRRMEQVFVNLFTNAVHAMAQNGGKLSIRTYSHRMHEVGLGVGRRASDVFRIGENSVVVEIEDEGHGIAEDSIGKILDPFFTTKRNDGGTGLGLSVVRSIVEMHKGLILIRNRPTGGVKVTLTLKTEREDRGQEKNPDRR